MMRALPAFALLAFTIAAHATSFDCKLAKTPREKATCASPKLSQADSGLGRKYNDQRKRLTPQAADIVQTDQRAWLFYLDAACAPNLSNERADIATCLLNEYKIRSGDLDLVGLHDGQLVYTRGVYVAKTSPSSSTSSPFEPGVGIGDYAWPQFDKPTPTQAAFNLAVEKYVVGLLTESSHPDPQSLQQGTDDDGSQQITWKWYASNAHWAEVHFERFFMKYGGAHPETFDSTFIWNLDKGQQLQATDVFHDATGWQQKLIPLIQKKLYADVARRPYYSNGDLLTQGIQAGLKRPTYWTLTPRGLTIKYAQYDVCAYAAGMPEVHFTWTELKPFLNTGFDPATLPSPDKR